MRHRVICLPLLVMSAACATVQQGPQQRIHVESQPSAAVVTVAPDCGGRRAARLRTPATVWVSRRATRCSLTLSFPGYTDQAVTLTRVISGSVGDNFVAVNAAESLEGGVVLGLFTAVGVGIDALTGAMWEQVPSRLSLTLVEEDTPGEESKRPEERSEDRPEDTPER